MARAFVYRSSGLASALHDQRRPVTRFAGLARGTDAAEGVEFAEAFRPDLIVLDIGLPKMNGYDACCRVRERPGAKDMLIVAATGWRQDEDRRRSKEAGFDYHLVKPVDAAKINRLRAERKS